jgi:arylsulfatase A-like enzyme/Flp pilus assembly protein TadD
MNIRRHRHVQIIGLSAVLALCLLAAPMPATAAARLPPDTNVLLIAVDTLRYDRIGILTDDRHVKTPNIDRLARRSHIFTRAFAHDPLTRPSFANIMTGTTPPYHGVVDNPGYILEDRFLTLAEHLKAGGYDTAAFISAIILDHRSGFAQGFDLYDDENGAEEFMTSGNVERDAGVMAELAGRWISGRRGKWFCWLHIFDPHDPYEPPEPYRTEYADDLYSGEVAYVDAQLGPLLESLEKSGQLDKTIVIFTGDHGEALGEKSEQDHGFFAYNNTLHIPLFLTYPGAKPGRVGENVCHADIFPTVCDLLGLPIPEHIQGESLLPIAAGKKRKQPKIFFESMAPHNGMDAAPLEGFIEGNIKFIDLPLVEVYDIGHDYEEENNRAPGYDIPGLKKSLEALKSDLKGKPTKQNLKGKSSEIIPLLRSLGYIAGQPTKGKQYGVGDDPKSLYPLILSLRQAIFDAQEGRLEPAVSRIRTVARIRPQYVTAYTTLSKIYYGANRMAESIAALEEGLKANPENINLTGNLGIMHFLAKDYRKAAQVLGSVTSRARFNPEYFNYLGMAHMNLKELKPAEEAFNEALEIDPTIGAVYNNLGYLNLSLYVNTKDDGRLALAIENFDKALRLDPGLPSALKGRERALSYGKKSPLP